LVGELPCGEDKFLPWLVFIRTSMVLAVLLRRI
jgi:hypothetical protein